MARAECTFKQYVAYPFSCKSSSLLLCIYPIDTFVSTRSLRACKKIYPVYEIKFNYDMPSNEENVAYFWYSQIDVDWVCLPILVHASSN